MPGARTIFGRWDSDRRVPLPLLRLPDLNPVQSAVLRLQRHPGNIVIAAETSSGKTVAAELLMDVTLAAGAKVIYLSPLKALTEEKCAEWGRNFPDHRLIVMTGDYQPRPMPSASSTRPTSS